MERRTFIGACAGSLIIARSGAEGQSTARTYRVGFLTYATPEQSALLFREFTEGLGELGYIDGRNIVIEPYYGDGTLNSLPDLAAGVVRSRVDIIVTGSNPIAAAAKRATTTIPIVMVGTLDPVGFGLVASLARPGANITGLCVDASDEMSGKFLSLLTEIVPGLARVGSLQQVGYQDPQLEVAARRLNVERYVVDVRTIDELESAFAAMLRKRVDAVIFRGTLFFVRRQQVADLALKHRLPAIHALKEYAQAPYDLWGEFGGSLSAGRPLRRQNRQGRQARRFARRAADEVRPSDQSAHREGTRAYCSPIVVATRA